MSLTASEEALVRRLLDQQAALLSLASNEATITSKLGATKVTLSDLEAASSIGDSDLFLTRQGASDKSVTGALVKQLAMFRLESYSEVRAYAGPNTLAYVTSKATPLDGGEGNFRVDSTDAVSSDNGGTILVDAIGRRWKREFSGAVNVKWFGAVGDGVTDDTAAIQAAIDYCATFAKWPSLRIIGLCLVTAPLIINRMVDTTTSEFLIVGEGTDSGLYTTTAITLFDSSLPFTIDPQSEFVTFSNLRFACNNAATTAYTISNKFLRVRFSGCYFHKIKCAVSSIYIQSWYFSNCNARFWSGIFLDVLTAFDVDFQSNIFEFGGPLFRTETLSGVRFIGNLYEGSSSPMIDLAGANGLMVVGNYTEGNAALDYRFGRTLGDVSRGIFFSGNVMLPTTLNVSNPNFYNVQWGLAYGVSQGNFCASRLHDTTFNTNDALSFIGDVSNIELYKGHKTGLTDPARVAVGRAVGIDTSKLFAASGNSYVALHPGLGGLELNISEIAGESLHMLLAPASPASGYFGSQPFVRGSIVFNSAAAVGAPKGWQCTASGTPGTWISMGDL